jgi:hypothetical protein
MRFLTLSLWRNIGITSVFLASQTSRSPQFHPTPQWSTLRLEEPPNSSTNTSVQYPRRDDAKTHLENAHSCLGCSPLAA